MCTPSYLFQHVLQQDIWNPSCPNFIMFWPRGEYLAYSLTNLPKLSINFPGLFHNTSNTTWIAPSLNCRCLSMHVHTSHQPYGYPLLMLCSWQQTHKNPWCNSRHLYYHYVGCWFPNEVRTTACASFKHVQFLL